jgi:isovaleryl-CoA dehydrogenase
MLRAASSALRRRAARAPRASCAAPGAAPQPSSPAPPPAAAAAASFFSTTGASGRDLFNPTEEHQALRDMVRSFAQDEVDPQRLEHDREEKFNHALFRKCGELGLLGVTTDVEYGGSGMDATAACIVHEELSQADPSFCLSYLAHSMLFVNNLNQNGNAEQKARLLPDVCSGAKIGGMGMSEPNNGTDVLGLTTTAVKDDADGSYVLNGTKMWITNSYVTNDSLGSGETGDVYLIYARTGGAGAKGLSLFLVEKGMEGFSLGQPIKDKCGMRASNTGELVLDNVRVPAANLVGDENGATLCMMRNLEIERVVLGAMATGIARRCIDAMGKYSSERKAFGEPIGNFGQIQKMVADSYAKYQAGRCYLYNVSNGMALDASGQRLDTDGVKLYTTTMAKEVADAAIQTMGGYGYCGEYQVEQLWRDAKLLEIGGGTLESHQKNMIRDLNKGLPDHL